MSSVPLNQAMKYFDELHLEGGILRKAGEIVAFTIGERLNSDTYVVHFEKAFPEIQGAYPMINQQFVMHNCQEYSYVNREDDAGDEGLRKAKLSYYPDILLKNYTARRFKMEIRFATKRDDSTDKRDLASGLWG